MKTFIKKGMLIFLFSLVILLAGWILGLFISSQIDSGLSNILFFEGLIIVIIAVMASMKGNPSGIHTQTAGQQGNQATQHENLQITQDEKKLTDYHKNFVQHSVTDFTFSTITLTIGGILLIITGYISG